MHRLNPSQPPHTLAFRTTKLSSFITTIFMSMTRYMHGQELPVTDLLHIWKLQALAATDTPATTPPYSFCFQQTQTDLPPSNYHLGDSQHCKRKRTDEAGNWVSSRWNPTPEQLQCLEELFCSGTRTPTAKQIQQIASKLQRFGKIEGKNVFYWFQNHKSRERQKLHRKMNLGLRSPGSVKKQTGLSRANADHKQAKNWASLSNSCTSSEESVSLQRAVIAECNADKRIRFEERQRELQQRGDTTLTVNARWQKTEIPPATTCTTAPETLLETRGKMLVKSQIFDRLLRLKHDNLILEFVEDERRRESQTLRLFPVSSQVLQTPYIVQDDTKSPIPDLPTNPIQFYEFFH